MDAANLTEKYILWSNILDLRSRGINIARTAPVVLVCPVIRYDIFNP